MSGINKSDDLAECKTVNNFKKQVLNLPWIRDNMAFKCAEILDPQLSDEVKI